MKNRESEQEEAAQASDILSTRENAIGRDEERMERVGDADHEAEVESALEDEGVPTGPCVTWEKVIGWRLAKQRERDKKRKGGREKAKNGKQGHTRIWRSARRWRRGPPLNGGTAGLCVTTGHG